MDLDAYRRTADSFTTGLMRECYRHYAGLKDSFERLDFGAVLVDLGLGG